jgi:hypothetical protein
MVSRCLSAAGIRFSVIRYPPGSWALLTVGLPNLGFGPRRGYHVPHARATTGEGALYTPGNNGAHPDRGDFRPGAYRFAAASPCTPPHIPSTGLSLNEASTRVHTIRPSGLPLACGRPDGTGRPWAHASGSAPRRPRADDAHRGGDRPSSTDLELHAQLTSVDLQSSSSLNACDLVSHVAGGVV